MKKEYIGRCNVLFRRLKRYLGLNHRFVKTENDRDIFRIFPRERQNRISLETRTGHVVVSCELEYVHSEKEHRTANLLKNILKNFKSINYQEFTPSTFNDMRHHDFYERQFKTIKTLELPETLDELEITLDTIGVS